MSSTHPPPAQLDRGRKRKKGDAEGEVKQVVESLLGSRRRRRRIRCPKCAYQPKKTDRWFCSKCRKALWNTFDTRGRCPVCSYHWAWTACPACTKWSLHEAWYEKGDPSTS